VGDKSIGLEFYLKEEISPVYIDISDLDKYFQTRESLYRLLGITKGNFKNKKVLEVVAVLGQGIFKVHFTRD